ERDYSDEVAGLIDTEIRALIELAHDEAYEILDTYRDVLDNMVVELLDKETLTKDDLERIAGDVVKRPPMSPFNGTGKRRPSNRPPVEVPSSGGPEATSGSPSNNGTTSGSSAVEETQNDQS